MSIPTDPRTVEYLLDSVSDFDADDAGRIAVEWAVSEIARLRCMLEEVASEDNCEGVDCDGNWHLVLSPRLKDMLEEFRPPVD